MANQMPLKLWEHPDPKSTQMYAFMQAVNARYFTKLETFHELFDFSVQRRTDFWSLLFDWVGFIHEGDYRPSAGGGGVVDESQPIDAVPRWFDGVRLSFAENMLYSRTIDIDNPLQTLPPSILGKEDDRVAVVEVREAIAAGIPPDVRSVTWGMLRQQAATLAHAMATGPAHISRGDRVFVVGANSVHTLLVWLATSWLGALFSSTSTDTGAPGILQRVLQLDPRLLFMDDIAVYAGRTTDLRPKMAAVAAGLRNDPGCRAFSGVVAIPRFVNEKSDLATVQAAVPDHSVTYWDDFLCAANPDLPIPPIVRIPFSDPYLICFSSGTTGTPKPIVHSVGGVLLAYMKEARLHENLGPDTIALQYTTTGWIMYVAAVAVLIFGCRVVLYDGSPFHPDRPALLRILVDQHVTKLGTGPRWLLAMQRHQAETPGFAPDLSALRTVTSTGMILAPELQQWFYQGGLFPSYTHLANVSGGTDIAGCFGCCNVLLPVYKGVGGTQGPSLGVDVRLYEADDGADPDADGYLPAHEVAPGHAGELVAVQSFPNIPCFFWNDPGSGRASTTSSGPAMPGHMILRPDCPAAPPGSRYHDAYFARFRHVWAHGDYCVFHPAGQIEFLGRADGVLNPSGVRFGSAEIYAVLDRHFAPRGVVDSLCIGQRRPGRDHDESVLLFILMHPEAAPLDARLAADIRAQIAKDLSKRHVPRYIFPVPAIPTTVNMKKVELPVKHIVSGRKVTPSGALANPESLDYFYQFADLEDLLARGLQAKL